MKYVLCFLLLAACCFGENLYKVCDAKGVVLFTTTDSIQLQVISLAPKVEHISLNAVDSLRAIITSKLKKDSSTFEWYRITWTLPDGGFITLIKPPETKEKSNPCIITDSKGQSWFQNNIMRKSQ